MGTAKFTGHFGSTHPAGKMLPKEEADRTKGDYGTDWYKMKKYHKRKSRQFFRNQIHHIIRYGESKI